MSESISLLGDSSVIPFHKQHLLQAVNEELKEDLSKKPGVERIKYTLSFIHTLIFVMHRPLFLTFSLTPELILSFFYSVRREEGRGGRKSKHRERERKQKRKRDTGSEQTILDPSA